MTKREYIESYDDRELARFLATVAGYGGNKEEVDFWEDWLKTERPKAEPWADWYDIPSDEMTIEQARQAVKDLRKKLAEYLEQEPCEDCISRQATVERLCKVADFMNEKRKGLGSPYIMAALFIQDNKDEFPSVTPKEKSEYEHDHDVVKAYHDGQAYILDKIETELLANAEMHEDGDYYLRDKWVSEIIDKYRQEG